VTRVGLAHVQRRQGNRQDLVAADSRAQRAASTRGKRRQTADSVVKSSSQAATEVLDKVGSGSKRGPSHAITTTLEDFPETFDSRYIHHELCHSAQRAQGAHQCRARVRSDLGLPMCISNSPTLAPSAYIT
jgi:hypothetical protein